MIMFFIFCTFSINTFYIKINTVMDTFYIIEKKRIKSSEEEDEDIENAIYSVAIKEERRNFFCIFFIFFIKSIEIINMFIYPGDYDVISISISSYLFSIVSDFTMNALLFSDDVISEKYKNGSVNKYTTLMLSFLSNVLGYFFGMILCRLTNFSQCLELFAKEPKKEKIYIKKFKN